VFGAVIFDHILRLTALRHETLADIFPQNTQQHALNASNKDNGGRYHLPTFRVGADDPLYCKKEQKEKAQTEQADADRHKKADGQRRITEKDVQKEGYQLV
jgi:hypothetical protein